MTTTVPPFVLAEQTEIRAYVDFVTGAAAPVREALGIDSLRAGSALALAIREDTSRFFNRAGGFGTDEPITVDVLAQVCDFYRERGLLQGALMVAPSLLPPDWAATADELNLGPGNRLVKLGCDIESALFATDGVAALDPGLRVEMVEAHHAYEWATVMMTTFGFTTPGLIDMAASSVGRPNWRQYAVWEGERIIAVGSVFFNGLCANMFGGATIPEGRGRGAQSALLTARARAALAAGCRWLVAETGAEGPGDHNTSLHNMLRAGFEPLYERLTWLWHA
ncbi:N-acetyltransferase [Streptomyces mirabilis]|uniref:N-acetyltransferase n=1 Tax=Streptomyces mirabilis TaxID=68239 RepID=A0ABU3V552_9ACTN|nr:N-acetyltransferase [Streptomyces mirabilis]MCX5355651.1 N-acetyltransferase [Streptomyces mirabilis]MDU9001297.1 N-acetyltransferase [Streptomyces mirabilis]